MPSDKPERPRTQTSAPVEPARTTKDPAARERDDDAARREAADERAVRGDHMPAGADEPGAGL